MTTPERLRARQRREGFFILIIGLCMAVSTIVAAHQRSVDLHNFEKADKAERACLTRQVTMLTDALTARGKLAQADADAATTVILAVGRAKTNEEIRTALDAYKDEHDRIAQLRVDSPVPPFPNGTCDS